ncbi:MAG: mechanosensitive ion channel family protein, partial [Deltaproteobacteria bacterium]|nr:mechanosensitive ion channel family protein [Deltaproteobacteria bacterium]
MLPDLFLSLYSAVTRERALDAFRAALIVGAAYLLARVLRRWATGLDTVRADPNRAVLVGRLVEWGLLGLGIAGALEELGFKLHVLLGAAGVASVAIGFAAQTTLSNLISGFFLYGEEPFRIGETIEVDGLIGEVLRVGTLATTLRTPDHRFVRIPNELLIKSKLTNHSRLPARRLEFTVTVPQSTPFEPLRDRLVAAARACP